MTPKSLLRHKLAVSSLNDLGGNSKFLPLIDEVQGNISASRVIFCSGKVYYDLFEARTQHNINNIIIIRVEQLYPLDMNLIKSLLTKYNTASEYIWCQEEPKNMGAWSYIKDYLDNALANLNINNKFIYIGREAAASPAVGSLYIHNQQQEELIKNALKLGE
jgi:2-oxoglutarate dehydrogenase E1 component